MVLKVIYLFICLFTFYQYSIINFCKTMYIVLSIAIFALLHTPSSMCRILIALV